MVTVDRELGRAPHAGAARAHALPVRTWSRGQGRLRAEARDRGHGYRRQWTARSCSSQLGYSHPVDFPAPEGILARGEKKVSITGVDKALVGQIAANIREKRPPEPYKGKGIKYEGERIRRKAGKSAGA